MIMRNIMKNVDFISCKAKGHFMISSEYKNFFFSKNVKFKCLVHMFSSKAITYQMFDSKIQLKKIVVHQWFDPSSIQK
jgi:hypothetical protein